MAVPSGLIMTQWRVTTCMSGQENARCAGSLLSTIGMGGRCPSSSSSSMRIRGGGEGRRWQGCVWAGSQPGGPALESSEGEESLDVLPQADELGAWERGEEGWVGAVVFERTKSRRQRFVTSLERLGLAKLASSRTQQLAGQQEGVPEGETAVVIEMEVRRSTGEVKLSGSAGTAVALRCRRCFCHVAEWIEAEYALTLTPTPIEEPSQHSLGVVVGGRSGRGEEEGQEMDLEFDDKLHFPGEASSIDVSKYFRDALHLEVPFGMLCELSCKGVCERCGQNLNEGTCDCKERVVDVRWSALEQLKAQLHGTGEDV